MRRKTEGGVRVGGFRKPVATILTVCGLSILGVQAVDAHDYNVIHAASPDAHDYNVIHAAAPDAHDYNNHK